MVRSYTRYEAAETFGLVCSNGGNSVLIEDDAPSSSSVGGSGRGRRSLQAVVPALEQVAVWDVKKGELLRRWRDPDCRAEVTRIARNDKEPDTFAVGYSDGAVRLWSLRDGALIVVLNGHRSAITALAFDASGTRLASGSRDTNIVIWDVIAETGVARLKGHSDQITGLAFVRHGDGVGVEEDELQYLVSTSKDSFIKVWDVLGAHCIETHTANRGECWGLAVHGDLAATAGLDGEIKLWTIAAGADVSDDERIVIERGAISRQSKSRPQTLIFHPNGQYLACHGTDKACEVFRLRSQAEIEKLLKRRRKRKAKQDGADAADELENDAVTVEDNIVSYVTIRAPARIRSIDWRPSDDGGEISLMTALSNNAIEVHTVHAFETLESKKAVPEVATAFSLELPGHQGEIRCGALSSASDVLATASDGQLKVWNAKSGSCIRTLGCGTATALTWALNDRYIVVATKAGELEVFEVAAATMIESIAAHEGAISSLQVHPDGASVITGGADKTVKFWRFDTASVEIAGTTRSTQRLTLKQQRTLKLTDDVLAVRYSPDGKLLAVSLLDATVKVFFADTLKFFLSLYGHKLPVLDMDIATDSKLLVTCSADKNVKLWGLDFGDCHKSIFAHNDAVLRVRFERQGHNFFSCGRDRQVRYWDGDRFESILRLEGHHADVTTLEIGGAGEFLVTAGHDRSVRIWRESDDPVFLEEERERELEEMYEDQLAEQLRRQEVMEGRDDDEVDGVEPEVATVGQSTVASLTAGEKVAEALEVGESDLALMRAYEVEKRTRPTLSMPQRHPVLVALGNVSAERHVLNVVRKVKSSHLEDALLVLPFDRVVTLLEFCDRWARNGWEMALTTRILLFLLRAFNPQIVANRLMRPMLDSVRRHLRAALAREKDLMGANLAALRHVRQELKYANSTEFGDVVEAPRKRAYATLL